MRRLVFGALAVGLLVLTSCDEQKRLAREIKGEWISEMESLPSTQMSTASITDNFAFVADSTGKSGMVVATGMIEVTTIPAFTGRMVETVDNGIAAQSTVQGRWSVIDDDELTMTFDYSTMEVNVDPTSIGQRADVMGDQLPPDVEKVSEQVAQAVKSQLQQSLREHYSSLRLLDDVKVKDNRLTFEVAERKYILHREV